MPASNTWQIVTGNRALVWFLEWMKLVGDGQHTDKGFYKCCWQSGVGVHKDSLAMRRLLNHISLIKVLSYTSFASLFYLI